MDESSSSNAITKKDVVLLVLGGVISFIIPGFLHFIFKKRIAFFFYDKGSLDALSVPFDIFWVPFSVFCSISVFCIFAIIFLSIKYFTSLKNYKRLHNYDVNKARLDALGEYANSNNSILSIQLYNYKITGDSSDLSDKALLTINCTLQHHYTKDQGANVNLIGNISYELPRGIYKDFEQCVDNHLNYYHDLQKSPNVDLEAELYDKETDLINELKSCFSEITDINKVQEKHFSLYRIYSYLNEMRVKKRPIKKQAEDSKDTGLRKQYGSEIEEDEPRSCFLNENIESYVVCGKRTGLLASVLTETPYYCFNQYSCIKAKRKRIYCFYRFGKDNLLSVVLKNSFRCSSTSKEEKQEELRQKGDQILREIQALIDAKAC